MPAKKLVTLDDIRQAKKAPRRTIEVTVDGDKTVEFTFRNQAGVYCLFGVPQARFRIHFCASLLPVNFTSLDWMVTGHAS